MYYLCDPGHAWLRVSIKSLIKYDLINQISIHSYLRGGFAYLEEDKDAPKYLNACGYYANLERKEIPSTHTNKRSRVRNYQYYTPLTAMKLHESTEYSKRLKAVQRG